MDALQVWCNDQVSKPVNPGLCGCKNSNRSGGALIHLKGRIQFRFILQSLQKIAYISKQEGDMIVLSLSLWTVPACKGMGQKKETETNMTLVLISIPVHVCVGEGGVKEYKEILFHLSFSPSGPLHEQRDFWEPLQSTPPQKERASNLSLISSNSFKKERPRRDGNSWTSDLVLQMCKW